MSELSNKKPGVTESLGGTAELGAQIQPKGKPVQLWATLGAVILALRCTCGSAGSPDRTSSGPAGPNDPPLHMKIPMIANAVVLWVGLPFAIWFFFIRPWRRERRITLDGMLFCRWA